MKHGHKKQAAVKLAREHLGLTSGEIAKLVGMHPTRCSKALSEVGMEALFLRLSSENREWLETEAAECEVHIAEILDAHLNDARARAGNG